MRFVAAILAGLTMTVALWFAAAPAGAATVTFPVVGFTATSLTPATLAMGTTTLNANLTLAGSTYGADYVGTLGSSRFDIAAFIATACSATTAGWTVICSTPPAWGVEAIVNASSLTTEIDGFRFTFTNAAGTISCALQLTVQGRYSGLLTVTGTTLIGASPQPPGFCPVGTPSLSAVFRIFPGVPWTLRP